MYASTWIFTKVEDLPIPTSGALDSSTELMRSASDASSTVELLEI